MLKILFIITGLFFTHVAAASDAVPYSVNSIKNGRAGFVELVGPGKIQINGSSVQYTDTKYIRTTNINSLTNIADAKGCMLHYSSEGYTENISVITQSCNDLISIMRASD